MKFYSQIGQDKFVAETLDYKRGGFFVDIGCHRPRYINNTYALEKELDWRGISIDSDPKHLGLWSQFRDTSMLVCQDALEINYKELFDKYNAPATIDYLSMDLYATTTLEALYKLPFDSYSFRTITYEHDNHRYSSGERKIEEGEDSPKDASRKFLFNLGYKLIETKWSDFDQDDFWENGNV